MWKRNADTTSQSTSTPASTLRNQLMTSKRLNNRAALFAVLLYLSTSLLANAQLILGPEASNKYKEPSREVIDTASLIAIYGHWMHDDILDDNKYEDDILAIGSHNSLYSSYGTFRIDSTYHARYPNGCTNLEWIGCAAGTDMHLKYTRKNFRNSNLTDRIAIGFNHYIYSEPIPEMNWEITDTTANFKGLSCVKAKCHFRGRDWAAWFAPDVPVSDGPWKFHGLPGLIIHIEDADRTHIFSILGLRKPQTNGEVHQIKIPKPDSAFPTTREKALKRTYEVAMDPRLLNEEGFKGDTGIFGQRYFYAPLELE